VIIDVVLNLFRSMARIFKRGFKAAAVLVLGCRDISHLGDSITGPRQKLNFSSSRRKLKL